MSGAKTDAEQRTLSVLVSRASLSSSMGPRKEKTRSFLQGLQLWKRVEVEATAHDSSDSVFYAPFPHDEGSATLLSERGHRPIATQFLTVDPYSMRVPDLVSDHDDFELSFVGMNVPQGGPHISNAHDLLLYSTRAHVFPDAEDEARPHPTDGDDDDDVDVGADADETTSRVLRSAAMSELSVTDANGIDLLPCDVPFIHYDPATDGREESGMANAFLPVPASKAVIRQHNGKTEVSFVPLRFSVFEVDKVTSAHARAVARSSSVNALARRSGLIVPSSDVISSAVAVANSMGRAKLRRYKRPDHVMSKDMEFRLVSKARAGASGCSSTSDDLPSKKYAGTYLRVSQSPPPITALPASLPHAMRCDAI